MSLLLKRKKTANIPPLESGTYAGVCVGIIDIGEQKNEKFGNYAEKVIIIFEIPSETVEIDGEQKPRWVSETYTKSLSDKSKLLPMLTSWRGRRFTDDELNGLFDLASMAGEPALLQILLTEKEDKQYNNIGAVMQLPKGYPVPVTETEPLIYDMDNPDEEVYEKLPEWIRERIMKSTQYRAAHTGTEELDIDEPAPAENAPAATKPAAKPVGKKAAPF